MRKSLVRVLFAVMTLVAFSFAGTVTVTSPSNGATVSSPARFAASATSTAPITSMRIYVDNISAYTVFAKSLDTTLAMSAGTHNIVVQAWDSTGAVFKTPLTVTVPATPTTPNTISVTAPTNGATVTSPTRFTATATNAVAMKIYVDSIDSFTVNSGTLDTTLAMTTGVHSVIVQSWDRYGNYTKAPLTVTVASSTPMPPPPTPTPTPTPTPDPGTTIPSTARTYANIDEMPGWENCTVCAGIGAAGPVADYSMTQNVATPSMDGKSAKFWIGGKTPYSDALWWKQLGGDDAKHHFVYDLYFYIEAPQYAQALEFDVNQSNRKNMYIMGVQCNIKGVNQWDVWDGLAKKWAHTGVTCLAPPAYQWNHLTEEFVRDDNGNVTFVAITLNGQKHYINRTYGSLPKAVSEINVAFQMDGDYAQHQYTTYVDKITLYTW